MLYSVHQHSSLIRATKSDKIMQVYDIKKLDLSNQPHHIKGSSYFEDAYPSGPKSTFRPLFSSRVQYNCQKETILAAIWGRITLPERETIREWKACEFIVYPFAKSHPRVAILVIT